MTALTEHRLPPLSGTTKSVVIVLHGLGDSGSGGLLDLCRLMQRELPDTEFLCPDAPQPFDGAPGMGGRQWFPLREFTQAEMEAGVIAAAPALNAYIDQVLASRNLDASRLVLAGFSQGCMMALYTAPRRAEAVGGVLGYSGALVGGATLAAEKQSAPPVLLIHGMQDDVVPFGALRLAEQSLTAAGIAMRTLPCPGLGHSIDERGIAAGLDFLRSRF